jgi:hypothetical protein
VKASHRKTKSTPVLKPILTLHKSLAKGTPPHHKRPIMVLQGRGNDLARRRRLPIHQNNYRSRLEGALIGSVLRGPHLLVTALRHHYLLPLYQKFIGDGCGRRHDAARIPPKVEEKARHPTRIQRVQMIGYFLRRRSGKAVQIEVPR